METEVKDPIVIDHEIPLWKRDCYYTVTEVKRPPSQQEKNLQQAKFIMTQSTFCKERYSKITDPKKIKVVNFPFLPQDFSPMGSAYPLVIPKQYKFKFFCMARYDVRKNIPPLVKAFVDEFKDNDDVCLILKLGSDRYCIPKEFKYAFGMPDNVYWMDGHVPHTAPLYRAMDAYCIADCGEGWGAPTTEAMLCGLPTIAPNHSGHLDYMNKDNSYLIDVGDWERIGARNDNYYMDLLNPEMEWKVPIFSSIKENLRKCYEEFKDIPKVERLNHPMIKKSLDVKKIVSPSYVGRQITRALKWAEFNI